jgi:hypothetical protein
VELPYPARQEKGMSGFAETAGCGVLVSVFPFCLGLFLCFCPHTATLVNVTIRMTSTV